VRERRRAGASDPAADYLAGGLGLAPLFGRRGGLVLRLGGLGRLGRLGRGRRLDRSLLGRLRCGLLRLLPRRLQRDLAAETRLARGRRRGLGLRLVRLLRDRRGGADLRRELGLEAGPALGRGWRLLPAARPAQRLPAQDAEGPRRRDHRTFDLLRLRYRHPLTRALRRLPGLDSCCD
jgi:hypothetical protein